jgi:hypothetical protein
VFSGIHLDWIPKDYSLTGDEFNSSLTQHWKTYGPLPFGQPYTTLIDSSTYKVFGHAEKAPWLTMHTVGNKPRNHAIYESIEEIFRLTPSYPAANLEPYYAGWNHAINRPGGETPVPDSDRDNYLARAMMYGSVLSGALAGHVYGTAAYDVTSTGEPAGWRPHIWSAMRYKSGAQMKHLRKFVLSAGDRYQDLELANSDLNPRADPNSLADGLDGWTFMMRTATKDFALLYFELNAPRSQLKGFDPQTKYRWAWFSPRNGEWSAEQNVTANAAGELATPSFPTDSTDSIQDWAAKITAAP